MFSFSVSIYFHGSFFSDYKSPGDFESDIKLIVSNCEKYNKKNIPMLEAGRKIEKFFSTR